MISSFPRADAASRRRARTEFSALATTHALLRLSPPLSSPLHVSVSQELWMAGNGMSRKETEHKCIGIVEEALEKREAARNRPQPWIARKLAVFITIGIIGYAWYVYVGRFCVPMIRRDEGALGSRAMGGKSQGLSGHAKCVLTRLVHSQTVAFLVVFSILGLIMIWAYEKVRRCRDTNVTASLRLPPCA